MDREELERRYVRKPKPHQKPAPLHTYWFAYKGGEFVGEVKLTNDTKSRYEAMGYVFKRRRA